MKFDIIDLARVIGKKFGVEITDDFFRNLGNISEQSVPVEFLDEFLNIAEPLIPKDKDSELKIDSIEDMYKLVPKEYLDQIPLIGDDGRKVMSLEDLNKAIKLSGSEHVNLNTNENADKERELLKASFVHDEYPVYAGLEHSWRSLDSSYYDVINREDHPAGDPLSSFSYNVNIGFYPPPEIMLIFGIAIERYFDSNGNISLDEAFFGEKHQKTKSLAYKKHKKRKYMFFDFYVRNKQAKNKDSKLSLEEHVSNLLEDTHPFTLIASGFSPDVDVDTFLRGYRRWKKELREGKYK